MEIATVPIAANQVEYHVGMAGGADSQSWMRANNITLLSYLPLCGQCDGADGHALINGSLVSSIGAKHGKSGAQVCTIRRPPPPTRPLLTARHTPSV